MSLCPGEQKVIEGMEGTLLGSRSDMSRGPEGRATFSDGAQRCAPTWLGHTMLSTEAWKVDMLHSSVIVNKDKLEL